MQTDKQTDFANHGDTISRQAAIDALTHKWDGMVTSVFDVINSLPSAQPDLDSAYTEGYTQAEAKYRKMWDEMQANIKAKAFGKRKGLIHTADIDAMPTIEERKTGKWIDGYKRQRCSICRYNGVRSWEYCPSCGARMVGEGEDNERA